MGNLQKMLSVIKGWSYFNTGRLNKEVVCGKCKEVFRRSEMAQVIIGSYEHFYCYDCAYEVIETEKKICPACRNYHINHNSLFCEDCRKLDTAKKIANQYHTQMTRTVRFTRNPQFTPASLSARELSRIEWLVKALFERNYRPDAGVSCDPMRGDEALKDLANWMPVWGWEVAQGIHSNPERKVRHQARLAWLVKNPAAVKYFTSCWNYLLAVARRNGEVSDNTKYTRAYYAERSYGYN